MNIKKSIVYGLAACLVVSLLPARAFAADDGSNVKTASAAVTPSSAPSIDFRAAARDAAVKVDRETPRQIAPKSGVRHNASPSPAMQGGGGGKSSAIMMIVGTVVGLGATVYMLKQMKKTTDAANSGGQ